MCRFRISRYPQSKASAKESPKIVFLLTPSQESTWIVSIDFLHIAQDALHFLILKTKLRSTSKLRKHVNRANHLNARKGITR